MDAKNRFWLLKLGILLSISSTVTVINLTASAQIVPDSTLGKENSLVTPQGIKNVITGGAIRDTNLFHSFLEFNVNKQQQVYFTNPSGIANILTRVTGNNISHILGTLGVNGNANLFLINPNGIIFGQNAKLDIAGSFAATTADSIIFDNYKFSATNQTAPLLLKINLTPGLQYGTNNPGSKIRNEGILSVGQDLTFIGDNLDLKGQLSAGNNLTLIGTDSVKIRDSITQPFIAKAGNNLLLQGNQTVDIFALNHPHSGLFSGGNMVLRSANSLGGDAHYTSGGNFRIEQLDGSLGNLFSPQDPIIRASGDVSLASYQGASLHILAGGKVEIPGTIRVQGADTLGNSINPTTTPTEANVTLSDGTVVTINGNAEPTVDIRAGTTAFGTPLTNTGISTTADINLGSILFTDINNTPLAGRVLLTNQYQPNPNLSGNIQLNSSAGVAIQSRSVTGGGTIDIDSKGSITLNSSVNVSAVRVNNNFVGNGGDVRLISGGNITLNSASFILSGGALGGNFTLKSQGDILLQGTSAPFITSVGFSTVAGITGGNVNVEANSLFLQNGALIDTRTTGAANAGDVSITAKSLVNFSGEAINGATSGVSSRVEFGATGNSGNIKISSPRIVLRDGTFIAAAVFGNGNAGELTVKAQEIDLAGTSKNGDFVSALASLVQPGATGNAGNVNVETETLTVRDGALITADNRGQGEAGNLTVTAKNIEISGKSAVRFEVVSALSTIVNQATTDKGGNLTIQADSLVLRDGGFVITGVNNQGTGKGGDLRVIARKVEIIGTTPEGFNSKLSTYVLPGATGKAGNLTIETDLLSLRQGGQVGTSTFGNGDAGNLTIIAKEVEIIGTSPNGEFTSQLSAGVEPGATGNAGNLTIDTQKLTLRDGGQVVVGIVGKGNGGELKVIAEDIQLISTSQDGKYPSALAASVEALGKGKGGSIIVEAQRLILKDGAKIGTSVFSTDSVAGNIEITTNRLQLSNDAVISTATIAGNGGDIILKVGDLLLLRNNSQINTTAGRAGAGGDGGNMNINAGFIVAVPQENSDIIANAFEGIGGNINITTNSIYGLQIGKQLTPLSDITASSKFGIDGTITLNTLDIDPGRGLIELPAVPTDSANKIVAGCISDRRARLVVTGRGGLPEDPRQMLRPQVILQDWRVINGTKNLPIPNPQSPIVEAQRWVINHQGNVELLANSPQANSSLRNHQINCS